MPIILLIRHGENDYVKLGRLAGRLPGVHLNEAGLQQAQQLANKLGRYPIKAVHASPLARAMETAQPLAEMLNLEIISSEGLLETDFGEWQGKTLKSLRHRKLWKMVQHVPSRARFPGGESFAECQTRICSEIDRICEQHKPKDMIGLVFHSDPIKLAIAHYIGLPVDFFQRLTIAPASISVLFLNGLTSRLINLNVQPLENFHRA